ncbi:MAG: SprT family zinc-dependent metalloprotease [Sulfurimonas sp.]|nr:SprT family zinc-dependent metalloprotease [Sulfurimonas sp.]
MSKLFYKSYEVELKHNPKLKNTYIGVRANKKIVVKTSNSSHSYILSILELRDSWIEKQFQKQQTHISLEVNLEDELLLFSQRYSIDSQEATLLREKLNKLRVNSKKNILKSYDEFYKIVAKTYLSQRAEYYSSLMGLSYNEIKYRKMRSRWGSCSSKKIITFNTELIKVDKTLIDYVVVHELAHLKHMNHSKDFHSLVAIYLPESKQLRNSLKKISLRS